MMYILYSIFFILFCLITWNRFNTGLALLFLLLPTYLIRFDVGFLPTTLLEGMVGIITIIWIIRTIKGKNERTLRGIASKHSSFVIALSLFILAATISIFTSIDLRSAAGEWKAFYVEPILIFLILITTIKDKKQLQQLLFALVLSGLATSVLAIYQHFTGWMVPWYFWENRDTFRVTGWYGFPNAVGLYLAPIIPMAVYLITQAKKKLIAYNWIVILCSTLFIPCSILAILFAKSTGALLGAIVGIVILLAVYEKTRWTVITLCIASLIGLIMMPTNSPFKQEILLQDYSGQLRVTMWGETVEFISHNPIKGAGLASYDTLIYPYRVDKWIEVFHHPHNIFLTMWVNIGIMGLVGFTWVFVWFFRVGLTKIIYSKNKLTIFLISSMIIIVIMGLVDSPYIKNDLAILFWVFPALLIIQEK